MEQLYYDEARSARIRLTEAIKKYLQAQYPAMILEEVEGRDRLLVSWLESEGDEGTEGMQHRQEGGVAPMGFEGEDQTVLYLRLPEMHFLQVEVLETEHGNVTALALRHRPGDTDLVGWWMTTAALDLNRTFPKAGEYGGTEEGSADLRVMGDGLATLLGWGATSSVALELACWFYILGKVARLVSDYQHRCAGKSDTWHDISVYSMMARRIQETGRWP